ncbi:hypothetical protein EV701_10952 [Chthoniobacter flavus]|nr:hypothetical protein EV701_10952 [Chthoniobacter flavus]
MALLGAATFQSPTEQTREAPSLGRRSATQGDWKVAPPSEPRPNASLSLQPNKDVGNA